MFSGAHNSKTSGTCVVILRVNSRRWAAAAVQVDVLVHPLLALGACWAVARPPRRERVIGRQPGQERDSRQYPVGLCCLPALLADELLRMVMLVVLHWKEERREYKSFDLYHIGTCNLVIYFYFLQTKKINSRGILWQKCCKKTICVLNELQCWMFH